MGLCDAGAPLSAQLDSFLSQTWPDWDLYIGDDGGNAGDLQQVEVFHQRATRQGYRVFVNPGPRRGFVANYLQLLQNLPQDAGLVALADQDDVWLPTKIERAVHALAGVTAPAMYCGARLIWTSATDQRRLSRPLKQVPSFRNALVENIAGGNTIVLNKAALTLIRQSPPVADSVFAHDWWIYLLVTGSGGQVIYDPMPHILYRQHSSNQIGAGEHWRSWARARADVLNSKWRERIACNLAALDAARDLLTAENQALLNRLNTARIVSIPARLRLMAELGLYRQNRLSQIGFWGAVALGRF